MDIQHGRGLVYITFTPHSPRVEGPITSLIGSFRRQEKGRGKISHKLVVGHGQWLWGHLTQHKLGGCRFQHKALRMLMDLYQSTDPSKISRLISMSTQEFMIPYKQVAEAVEFMTPYFYAAGLIPAGKKICDIYTATARLNCHSGSMPFPPYTEGQVVAGAAASKFTASDLMEPVAQWMTANGAPVVVPTLHLIKHHSNHCDSPKLDHQMRAVVEVSLEEPSCFVIQRPTFDSSGTQVFNNGMPVFESFVLPMKAGGLLCLYGNAGHLLRHTAVGVGLSLCAIFNLRLVDDATYRPPPIPLPDTENDVLELSSAIKDFKKMKIVDAGSKHGALKRE